MDEADTSAQPQTGDRHPLERGPILPKPRMPGGEAGFSQYWSLAEFPHPNPYFEGVPRPNLHRMALWGLTGLLGLGSLFLCGLFLYFATDASSRNVDEILIPAAYLGSLGLLLPVLVFMRLRDERIWRYGRIVPARVVEIHGQLGVPREIMQAAAVVFPIVLIILGLIHQFSGGAYMLVELIEDGETRTRIVRLRATDSGAIPGQPVWVVIGENDKARLAMDLRSSHRHAPLVTKDAKAWLDKAMYQAGPEELE